MAQPGNFTPILLYGSSTPTNVPLAANLTNSATGSEIAINVADKNLFFKDSGGTVNTVPIRQSSTSSNGWLSSTDWNTFNNKSNTNGTVTSVAALTIGTTGTDLSSTVANGTTTPVITLQVPTASATNRGALSSTDWSTFNGKQAALVSGTNIKTVSGVSLLGSGDVGTIGTGYGGTGLTSFTGSGILYASGSGTLATGSVLTFDGTTLQNSNAIASGRSGGSNGSFLLNRNDGAQVGSISVNTSTGSIDFTTAYGYLTFSNYLGEQLKVDNANVKVSSGNLTFGGSGKGIQFASVLNAYEEGTFTPSQGANLTVVGSFSSSGTYTKIGRLVTVTVTLSGSTSISWPATAATVCGNLPFTSAGTGVGTAFNQAFTTSATLISSGTNVLAVTAMAATPQAVFSITYSV